jgi:hypothetical protein
VSRNLLDDEDIPRDALDQGSTMNVAVVSLAELLHKGYRSFTRLAWPPRFHRTIQARQQLQKYIGFDLDEREARHCRGSCL